MPTTEPRFLLRRMTMRESFETWQASYAKGD